MTPQQNGAQPAFRESDTNAYDRGLTKREEFAKAAMTGLLADGWGPANDTAARAVWHADQLLQELAKPQTEVS